MATGSSTDPLLSLEEVAQLHDEAFVTGAYQVILGRQPDPGGMSNYLAQVRSGEDKMRIIAELAVSSEGKERGLRSRELESIVSKYSRKRASIWTFLFGRSSYRQSEMIQRQLRMIDNSVYLMEKSVLAHLASVSEQLAQVGSQLREPGAVKVDNHKNSNSHKNAPPLLLNTSPNLTRTFQELKYAIEARRRK